MFFNFFKRTPKVITRIAPSPTGLFHIGTARTALFNYLYAKHNGGIMRLRIEDTDKERSKKEYEEDIVAGLAALGIAWEGELWRQSERTDVYKKYLKDLLDKGFAYEAEENNSGTGKVIRFKNPNRDVTFTDEIRGDITFNTSDLGDFIIARDMETPLYNLTVVIDDFEMGVTHVVRGEDGISNTPRQILLQEAIGAPRPLYAHLPLILAPDKSKMSKRHGATSVAEYINRGFLPEALVNFLAKLGWSDGTDREMYDMDALIQAFSLSGVQKGGAVFNEEKLIWFNKEYMKNLSDDVFRARVISLVPDAYTPLSKEHSERMTRALPTIRERVALWEDAKQAFAEGEWDYLFQAPQVTASDITWKETPLAQTKEHLEVLLSLLEKEDTYSASRIKDVVWDYADAQGRGAVLWPLRYLLTGREKSADPFTVAEILGKEETLSRVRNAIIALNG